MVGYDGGGEPCSVDGSSLDTRTVHNAPALLWPVSRPLVVVHPGPSNWSKYGYKSIELKLLTYNLKLLNLSTQSEDMLK